MCLHSSLAHDRSPAASRALLGALISTGDDVNDAAFLRSLSFATPTPQERANKAQRMAHTVRGLPLDQWPISWTLYEALAVAMWLGLDPEGLVERLKGFGFRATR